MAPRLILPMAAVGGLLLAVTFLGGPSASSCVPVEPTGPTCEDAAVVARYDTCLAAQTEGACDAAGGTWGPGGFVQTPFCHCPTGQGDCPCENTGDCVAGCVAPLGDGSDGPCEGAQGHCAAWHVTFGCFCSFQEDGQAWGLCVD